MTLPSVDFLKRYLRQYPELRHRIQADPPAVLRKSLWVPVRKWRLQGGGIQLQTAQGDWVLLAPERSLRSLRGRFRPFFLRVMSFSLWRRLRAG